MRAAIDQGMGLFQAARLMRVVNEGLADAAITCWETKYTYNLWRPITAIRNADQDGNPATTADPTWTPLWATPGFPEYTSGHSTFSWTAATILTKMFGDNYAFTSVSDPKVGGLTRNFTSFYQAAAEAGYSRVVGGIHFSFGNLGGQKAGQGIGEYVASKLL